MARGNRPIERISFVYTPYGSIKNEPGIKVVKDNYGVFPSLSLAYVAAVAEKAGAKIQFIDAHALGLSKQQTIKRLDAFRPDLVAYTTTTYLFHQNLDWFRDIREARTSVVHLCPTSTAVTFSPPFAGAPAVVVTPDGIEGASGHPNTYCVVDGISTTGFTYCCYGHDPDNISWIAIYAP